jgi:hypothetical protein
VNDPVDELLRAEPYLEDKGFTQRVMQSLPPRRSAAQVRGRVLLGFGLAATTVFVLGPGRALATVLSTAPLSWSTLLAATVAVAVGAGTAVSIALREAQG